MAIWELLDRKNKHFQKMCELQKKNKKNNKTDGIRWWKSRWREDCWFFTNELILFRSHTLLVFNTVLTNRQMFYARMRITDRKFLKRKVWIRLRSNLLLLKELRGHIKNRVESQGSPINFLINTLFVPLTSHTHTNTQRTLKRFVNCFLMTWSSGFCSPLYVVAKGSSSDQSEWNEAQATRLPIERWLSAAQSARCVSMTVYVSCWL